jgi:hypothetical protein
MPTAIKEPVFSEEIESAIKSSHHYKKNITSPRTALEWQLALANPLWEIGRDYFTLVLKECIQQKDIIHFQQRLAYTTFIRQQRANEYTLRELEYKETQEREKLLQAWAAAQVKQIPVENLSNGFVQQILDLLSEISRLAFRFSGLTMQQTEVDKQWNRLYQLKVQHIFSLLKAKNISLPFELTEAKQKQLSQALTPLSPGLLLKLHPGLAKNMRQLEEEDELGLLTVCLNLSRINDAMGELAFHARLTNDLEPLMGAALLAAIKQYKRPFQQAGISFASVDPDEQAAILGQQVRLSTQKEETSAALRNAERHIKDMINKAKENNLDLPVHLNKSNYRR